MMIGLSQQTGYALRRYDNYILVEANNRIFEITKMMSENYCRRYKKVETSAFYVRHVAPSKCTQYGVQVDTDYHNIRLSEIFI